MSEWMKEMERLTSKYGRAECVHILTTYTNNPESIVEANGKAAAARAALLAHAAQQDVHQLDDINVADLMQADDSSKEHVQSVELPEAVGTFYLDESTAQWSEYKKPPSVLTEGDSILYHEQALRTYGDAREAAGYARGLKELDRDVEMLRRDRDRLARECFELHNRLDSVCENERRMRGALTDIKATMDIHSAHRFALLATCPALAGEVKP